MVLSIGHFRLGFLRLLFQATRHESQQESQCRVLLNGVVEEKTLVNKITMRVELACCVEGIECSTSRDQICLKTCAASSLSLSLNVLSPFIFVFFIRIPPQLSVTLYITSAFDL